MRPIKISMAVVAGVAVLSGPLVAQGGAPGLDRALAAATFDTAWSTIGRTHWDTTYNGVDWQAVRRELRPRAEAARSTPELRAVLNDMLGRLRQSHFYLIPAEVQETLSGGEGKAAGGDGEAGMELRLVGSQVLVTRVDSGGAAEAAGVRPGWTVERLGKTRAADVLAAIAGLPAGTDPRLRELQAYQGMAPALAGPVGTTLEAEFRDGAGRAVRLNLARRPARGTATRYLNLPESRVLAEHRLVTAPGGARVGVIRFNLWLPALARRLDEAVDAVRGADGVVIDLRGNLGGLGIMAAGLAGHFIDRPDTLATQQMRGQTLFYVINPRRVDTQARPARPYAGPVAILTDALSASTTEFFAGGMQKLGRARVFGETSAGQALPAYGKRLPNGDVMMHAVADFIGPDGKRFEGAGVTPDVAAPPTRDALLAGRDPAMEAALAWIAGQRKP